MSAEGARQVIGQTAGARPAGRADSRLAIPAARASRRAQLAPAASLYVLGALLQTWPMPAHPATTIDGPDGDAFTSLADMREMVEHHLVPSVPGTNQDLAAPEGARTPCALYVATWTSLLPRWGAAAAFGPVVGRNLLVLSGYVLSGLAMFLLARRLSWSAAAALVAGWAFAFSQLAFAKGQVHVDYVHNGVHTPVRTA